MFHKNFTEIIIFMEVRYAGNLVSQPWDRNRSLSRTAFTIFGLDVYWYGIFIGLGIILGTAIAMRYMKKIGGNPDNVLDFMVYAIIFCIIGARLYYVIFSWICIKII